MSPVRVAWVTGASSGIGRALVLRLAREGWSIAASARRTSLLDELVRAAPPGSVATYPLDVTDGVAVSAAAGRIAAELGPITVAIFNAGVARSKAGEVEFENFALHADVNYLGVVRCIAAVLPAMQVRGSGSIVIVSSLAGYRGLPGMAPYAASKAALISLAESLQCDFAGSGVRFHVVTPGFVRTPMTAGARGPLPFLVSADEAAAAILRGLRRGRFRIAFPWPMALLSRVQRLVPDRLYFRLLRRRG